MVQYGYIYGSDTEYIGYRDDLVGGVWSVVDDTAFYAGASPLSAALPDALAKTRLRWAIDGLVTAVEAPDVLGPLDETWDRGQRRLDAQTLVDLDDADPARAAAAARVRAELLLGGGTHQTQLDYHSEVSFGRRQRTLAAEKPLFGDILLLGYKALLDDIAHATDALSAALGRDGADAALAPSARIRAAMQDCVASFTAMHGMMTWVRDGLPAGADRDRYDRLVASLDAFAARIQATATAAAATAAATPAATAPATPAAPTPGASPATPAAAGASAAAPALSPTATPATPTKRARAKKAGTPRTLRTKKPAAVRAPKAPKAPKPPKAPRVPKAPAVAASTRIPRPGHATAADRAKLRAPAPAAPAPRKARGG